MFDSYQYSIRNYSDDQEVDVCNVKMRKNVHTVKIKQRNTPEGVAKICGLWLLAQDESDCAKIDLCEGLGTWRVQTLAKDEQIVGLHHYVHSYEDENSDYFYEEKESTLQTK